MTERCLTTIISSGEGTFTQKWDGGQCAATGEGAQSCAEMHKIGSTILLSLSCGSLWEFGSMEVISDSSFSYPNISCGDEDVPFTMPNEDVTIKIYLKRKSVKINFIIANEGYGCVGLYFPQDSGCVYESFLFTLAAVTEDWALAIASPIHGYRVKDWKIDGASQNNKTNNLIWYISKDYYDIEIEFEEEPPCNKNQLTVEIDGRGSVSYPSGLYCDYLTLKLVPIPHAGYYFYGWEYPKGDANYTEDRNSLLVNMSGDRNVKAIFLEIVDFKEEKFKLFYCPSRFNKSNVINFKYSRDFLSGDDPSEIINCNFKITFYSDFDKNNKIYTTFSSDVEQWYYKEEDGYLREFPSDGIEFGFDEKEIIFDPEILPHNLSKTQKIYGDFSKDNDKDFSLICGVEYYIDIEVYEEEEENEEINYEFVKSDAIIFDFKDESRYLWDENLDENKWICSGQGGEDLKVSDIENSLNPSISSNLYGNFQIVWQETDNYNSDIYGGNWDSKNDIIYSSSQGFHNNLYIRDAYNPLVLTDSMGNFFISAYKNNSIKKYICEIPSGKVQENIHVEEEEKRRAICYPGLIKTDIENDILIRVYDEDKYDSYVLSSDKVLPVVNKEMIRLDIYGVKGAYAVRLRGERDNKWGAWIGINSSLDYSPIVPRDLSIEAYFLDNDRFIVPFKIDSRNGIKKACCQILTTYGITNTYCLDIFLNKKPVAYYFKFYEDSDYKNEVISYNGYFLVSGGKEGKTIYFKAIFDEPISQNITFNVIQQGINNIYNRPFLESTTDKKEFKGFFDVYKEDGVFNKDGKAFIDINFEEEDHIHCLSDESDKYNIIDDKKRAIYYKIDDVKDVYQESLKYINKKKIDNISFKQYYNEDDENFYFGNPNYFREDM